MNIADIEALWAKGKAQHESGDAAGREAKGKRRVRRATKEAA